MRSDAPSILSPDGSFKDRRFGLWLAAAATAAAFLAAAGRGMGILSDDPLNFQTAEALSWAEILTLRHTPIPLHMAICKLALLLSPSDPTDLIRLAVIPAHIVSSYLLWRLLEKHVRAETALAASVLFLFYRPGTEGVFWAGAAPKETYLLMFTLLALHVWVCGKSYSQWLAIAPAAGAVLAKPNGAVVIVLVAAYELLFPAAAGDTKRRDWFVPLAAMAAVCGALAVNARLNPGYYADYTRTPKLAESWFFFSQLIQMLAAETLPAMRLPVNYSAMLELAGFAVLLVLLAGIALKRRDYLFALLWTGIFMVPPVVLTGIYGSRYIYAASAGVIWLLAIGYDRLASIKPHGPKIAMAAAALWTASNCVLYADDLRTYRAAGQLGILSRDLILAHRGELAGAHPLMTSSKGIILPPIPSPNVFFLPYYLGRPAVPVEQPGGLCPPERTIPCVELHLSFENVRNCVPDHVETCIRWLEANVSLDAPPDIPSAP